MKSKRALYFFVGPSMINPSIRSRNLASFVLVDTLVWHLSYCCTDVYCYYTLLIRHRLGREGRWCSIPPSRAQFGESTCLVNGGMRSSCIYYGQSPWFDDYNHLTRSLQNKWLENLVQPFKFYAVIIKVNYPFCFWLNFWVPFLYSTRF